MNLSLLLAAGFGAGMTGGAALEANTPVPSGQPVDLMEVLIDSVGAETWLRFRFLAPNIARNTGKIDFDQVEPDLEYLCKTVALPYISDFELEGQVVVVTLLDRPLEFGQADPDVTQYIDAFRVSSGQCVWEGL